MNCPYCGKAMTLGYIQCRDGLHWTLKRQPIAALDSTAVYAYRCAPCKKITVDYSVHAGEPEA